MCSSLASPDGWGVLRLFRPLGAALFGAIARDLFMLIGRCPGFRGITVLNLAVRESIEPMVLADVPPLAIFRHEN
jgi:hypothetical protein